MIEQYLGEYFRLSLEDGDVVSGNEMESNSIVCQRNYVERYRISNHLYPDAQVMEFVDDGYSGTNFERPAIQKLLTLVKEGRICCIIVKDISRFGRNYLEVGDYLEQIFPFMGVRFISINDQYDSEDYLGTTGGIEVALRSLLYDMYSKDLSEKMLSSLMIRRKRGDYTSAKAPFGYQITKGEHRLRIDPTTSVHVKHIFELACMGNDTGTIARKLNEEGIPTPGSYRNMNKTRTQYYTTDGKGFWEPVTVSRILKNKVYLGTVVSMKTKAKAVGSKHRERVPDEERMYVPNMHEAIVTEEVFSKASLVLRKQVKHSTNQMQGPRRFVLVGFVKCGNCGRSVRHKPASIPYCYCRKGQLDKNGGCFPGRIQESMLEELVYNGIKERKLEESKASHVQVPHPDASSVKKQQRVLQREVDAVKVKKQALYEKYKSGQITREHYIREIENFREEESELKEQLARARDRPLDVTNVENNTKSQNTDETSDTVSKLTRDLVEKYVDVILIQADGEIEIQWKEPAVSEVGNSAT